MISSILSRGRRWLLCCGDLIEPYKPEENSDNESCKSDKQDADRRDLDQQGYFLPVRLLGYLE